MILLDCFVSDLLYLSPFCSCFEFWARTYFETFMSQPLYICHIVRILSYPFRSIILYTQELAIPLCHVLYNAVDKPVVLQYIRFCHHVSWLPIGAPAFKWWHSIEHAWSDIYILWTSPPKMKCFIALATISITFFARELIVLTSLLSLNLIVTMVLWG